MSEQKLPQEAKSSTKAIIYQMCVAVQKCYEMIKGQKVLIEELGDVTIEKEEQVEVKQYSDALTDNHSNFWNTLRNWLNDNFDYSSYKYLILYTTQQFGPKATIADWNDKKVTERLEILNKINKQAEARYKKRTEDSPDDKLAPRPSKVLEDQRFVIDPIREDKLIEVLEKVFIEASTPTLPELYKEIQQKLIKGILDGKRDDFLNSLIGFITKPQVRDESRWEITYEDFDKKVGELITLFKRETRIFPRKFLHNGHIDNLEISKYQAHLFIKKIQDIGYSEVIQEAVTDYLGAIKTVREEFKNYEVPSSRTDNYVREIVKTFNGKYRIALKRCDNIISDSQFFYDETITSFPTPFEGFDVTPSEFRNGLLHSELDDENNNLKWRLETNE